MSDTKPTDKPAAKSKLPLILGLVIVLLAGGGGAFWWMSRAHAEPKEGEHKAEAAHEAGGLLPLEPFIVNLADKSGSRFLRTTLKLVVPDEHAAEALEKNEVVVNRARSAIIELLSVQTAEHLVTPDGKNALKKEICEKVSLLTGGVEITDVLFSDFVVQF